MIIKVVKLSTNMDYCFLKLAGTSNPPDYSVDGNRHEFEREQIESIRSHDFFAVGLFSFLFFFQSISLVFFFFSSGLCIHLYLLLKRVKKDSGLGKHSLKMENSTRLIINREMVLSWNYPQRCHLSQRYIPSRLIRNRFILQRFLVFLIIVCVLIVFLLYFFSIKIINFERSFWRMKIIKILTLQTCRITSSHSRIYSGQFSQSGDYFISASQDETIRVYDTNSWKVLSLFPLGCVIENWFTFVFVET